MYRDAQGRLRVPGTMRVDELGQQFDLELEHEDVDSVSGLVLTLLGRPPRVGDTVRYDRLLTRGDRGQGARRRGMRGIARRMIHRTGAQDAHLPISLISPSASAYVDARPAHRIGLALA